MNLQHAKAANSKDIYEDLCNKIENLVYMPGQGISENELCEVYGASRHMVRGAFTQLKERRLIEVLPQRGTFVSLIDMEYIEEIIYLREATEQEAMGRIIESGNVKSICRKMNENIILQKKSNNNQGYTNEFHILDNQFHAFLMEEIGKQKVIPLISDLYIHVRRWRNLEVRTSDRMQQLIKEHERILQAIKELDAREARIQMHIHLDTVNRYADKYKDVQKVLLH